MKKTKLAVWALSLGGLLSLATTLTDEFEIVKNLEIFSNIYKEINTYYVDDVQPDKTMRYGMEAMLKSLDPYTSYLGPDEAAVFQSGILGAYVGIGAQMVLIDQEWVIYEIYENSPAQSAGLNIGDKLWSVDGKAVKGLSIDTLQNLVRGQAGSSVKFQVKRDKQSKNLEFELRRQDIKIQHLQAALQLDKGLGYLAIDAFTENISQKVLQACQNLKQQGELKGLIIDLRNNGGGLLSEAINLVNLFVDKGEIIVQTKGRDLSKNQTYQTLNPAFDTQIPLIILINEKSASASEIVAGALQDLDRALIIGRRSFGKGLVQQTKDLGYGAKLKYTASRYYIPSGRCIQAQAYENGLPKNLPDSLRASYLTRQKRKVLDGGGISPDVETHDPELDLFLQQLQEKQLIFKFALRYRQQNQSKLAQIKAKDFKLEEQDFEAFMQLIREKEFNLRLPLEDSLAQIKTSLEKDGYAQALQSEWQALEQKTQAVKQALFKRYQPAILLSLQNEILRQSHRREGMLSNNALYDPDIVKAVEILSQAKAYQSLLEKGRGQ